MELRPLHETVLLQEQCQQGKKHLHCYPKPIVLNFRLKRLFFRQYIKVKIFRKKTIYVYQLTKFYVLLKL